MSSLAICASLLLLTSMNAAGAPDQRAGIPANVMAALTGKFPQAHVDKWTKEKEDGKPVYDIEFHQGDRKFEADIFADGTIHNWERQIPEADLPQAVIKTVNQKFPHAVLKEIMVVTDVNNGADELTGYEVVIQRARKKDVEMTVAPNGKVLEGPGAER